MLRRLTLPLVAALALAACGKAPEGPQNAAARADAKSTGNITTAVTPSATPQTAAADFVGKMQAGDAFELQAATMAQSRASSAAVKDFAAMMLRDHTKSSADLRQAIATAGQSVAAGGSLTAAQQQGLTQLGQSPPQDFDKAYMAGQVQAHQDAVTVLQDYAQNGDVPALTAFASETLGVVQHHYQLAKSLHDQLK